MKKTVLFFLTSQQNGSVMVPFRNMFEALGATIQFEKKTQTITAHKNSTVVVLKIGSKEAMINQKPIDMTEFAEKLKAAGAK